MKIVNLEEVLSDSINNYLRQQLNEDESTFDEYFDELFFLHVLFERYSKELKTIISNNKYITMKERFNSNLVKLPIEIEKQRKTIFNNSFFNQSQIIFNILGLQYLLSLKEQYKDSFFVLKSEEKKILEQSFGYSVLFDTMIEFFCEKLNIPIDVKSARPKTIVEETYLYTHFFLMESDYFVNTCDLNNISDLMLNIEFVLEGEQGDLIAELYWALNFFCCNDYSQLGKLREFLLTNFVNGKWRFNYTDKRQLKHSQYSCIAAFLEELKRGTSYEY